MADNKKDGLNAIGSNSKNPSQILSDKRQIIEAIPHKNPRGKKSVTIKNTNAWDVWVSVMGNVQNTGQYAKLTTLRPDGVTVVPAQIGNGNGVTYSVAHSAGIDGYRDAIRDAELGFVGLVLDCGSDAKVDQFDDDAQFAWISDSLDGPTSFPLATKVGEAKSRNNQELQSRPVEFAGVFNRANDLVFILKANHSLMITSDMVHAAKSVR